MIHPPLPASAIDQDAAAAHVAQAERDCWQVPDVPADIALRPIRRVGILGAGTMGGGIAMNFANQGIPVTIVEAKAENLERGLGVVRRNYENSAKRGRFPMAEVDTRMNLLQGTLNFADLADCDLVIEAVFEDMAIKKQVFTDLDRICKPGAILATNTSYLNVNEIAAVTQRPEDVVGLHFFSPANVMKLLEIVRGDKTAKDVLATALDLAQRVEKIAVVVGVCYGFVGNRMLQQRQGQANALLLEGAMPWDVDRVLQQFGFRMGPFAMADLAGLDLGWNPAKSKGESLRDLLCEAGRRGQKTGAGYYDYDAERNASPSAQVQEIIEQFVRKQGRQARTLNDDEILARLLYPMINEAAKILEEGKANRASDVDVVWLHGYRWPANTGGPMFYADQVGLANIVATLETFAATQPNLAPAALLRKLAAAGGRFTA